MAMAIVEEASLDSSAEDSHLVLEERPRGRDKRREEKTPVASRRRLDIAEPLDKKVNEVTESKCNLALTSPRLLSIGRRA